MKLVYALELKENKREMLRNLCNKTDVICNFAYDKWNDILLIEVDERQFDSNIDIELTEDLERYR